MNLNMHFTHKSEMKRLPKILQDYISNRFMLKAEYLAKLRCFEFESVIGEKPVRRFRIVNTEDMKKQKIDLKTVKELEQYPELLVFEGYIDNAGKAYAADRRPPVRKNK